MKPQTATLNPQFFAIIFLFLFQTTFAQIKVLDGGRVGIGTTDVTGIKVHINCDQENVALKLSSNAGDWAYISQIEGSIDNAKALAIRKSGNDNFFVLCNGLVWSQGQFHFSDSRLKNRVTDIDNPMDKIMRLRGVYYHYKSGAINNRLGLNFNDTIKQHVGFIAQEVKLVVPEVVDSNSQGVLGINYSQLTALLVAGIQQQQTQINRLKTQINFCCNQTSKKNVISGDTFSLFKSSNSSGNQFLLFQNQPNPFSNKTEIFYQTPNSAENINIMIFNMQGDLIKSFSNLGSGKSSIIILAGDLRPGMYLYSLIADGNEIDTKRMILSE